MTQPDKSNSGSPLVRPSAGRRSTERERAERRTELEKRVRLDLWKAVWEASQVMTTEQIQDHVIRTLREIEEDQP